MISWFTLLDKIWRGSWNIKHCNVIMTEMTGITTILTGQPVPPFRHGWSCSKHNFPAEATAGLGTSGTLAPTRTLKQQVVDDEFHLLRSFEIIFLNYFLSDFTSKFMICCWNSVDFLTGLMTDHCFVHSTPPRRTHSVLISGRISRICGVCWSKI